MRVHVCFAFDKDGLWLSDRDVHAMLATALLEHHPTQLKKKCDSSLLKKYLVSLKDRGENNMVD